MDFQTDGLNSFNVVADPKHEWFLNYLSPRANFQKISNRLSRVLVLFCHIGVVCFIANHFVTQNMSENYDVIGREDEESEARNDCNDLFSFVDHIFCDATQNNRFDDSPCS